MDEEVPRLISELEASFEASLEFDENVAAADLAASMRRDQKLYDRVLTWQGARLLDGPREPVSAIATDHLVLGEPAHCLVRAGAGALVASVSTARRPVRRVDESLPVALRRWAGRSLGVRVQMVSGEVRGPLLDATPDHLLLGGPSQIAIPYEAVRWVSLSLGG